MLKELIVKVTIPKTQVRRITLFLAIMRFAVWVGGFGGVEFDIPERHLTKRAPDSRWAVGNCPRCHCIFDVELPAKSG
jgi:hypothetical protein